MRKTRDIIKDIDAVQEKIDTIRSAKDLYLMNGEMFYYATLDDEERKDSLYHVEPMDIKAFHKIEDKLMEDRAKLITELVECSAR